MLNAIIRFSIRNKFLIMLFVAALIGWGLYEVKQLPIDAVPDITDNQVQIITTSPSLGAPDIERFITIPVEQAVGNLPGLKEMRSFSRFGLSLITVVFTDKTDIYQVRNQLTERLNQVKEQLPAGQAAPYLAPVTTGLGEIYQYVLRPAPGYEGRYTATDLRTIQDWYVRRGLLTVPGVAEVSSFGGRLKQYEVAMNPAAMAAYRISMQEVFDALEKANANTGGAYIEHGPTALTVRSEGLVQNAEDIAGIVVRTTADGTPLLLRQIAVVRMGHATRYGAMTFNTKGEVAGAVVMMLKGGNSSEVIKNIRERVASIQKTLPEGVRIEPFLDRTKMVDSAIHTVVKNLLEGALIVLVVLIAFLGNWRAGLLVASVIPLAMLVAIILMNAFGVSGNLMSLGALDFGLIVDGAVIIVESVMHHLSSSRRRLTATEMDDEVEHTSVQMVNAAVFGQIIILMVYLPIFSLEDVEGKMFIPMAQTVAFALFGAFILSLTYVPMMSALFLSRRAASGNTVSDRVMKFLEQKYQLLLGKAFRRGRLLFGAAILLFGFSVWVLMRMGGEFIPQLEEGDFAVETRVLTGSNLQTSLQAVNQASGILLKKFPEVEKVVGKIGSSEVPTDPMPMNAADLMVILKPKKEWTSAGNFNELAEKMGSALRAIPGVSFGFQYPVQMRFNELMTGARQDVVCKIYGENLNILSQQANHLGSIARKIDGVRDLYIEQVAGVPEIVVRYNRQALAQYGITIAAANQTLNTALAGQVAGQVYEGEKRFDLVVRLDSEKRTSLTDIRNLLVPLPSAMQVPLGQLAFIDVEDGPNQIQRENGQRRIIVGFNVRGRDVESLVGELQQKVAAGMKLPAGYHVEYGGTFEKLKTAKARLGIVVPLALALIFLLLFFAFRAAWQALLIFTAIPLSAIGGILALALRGMPFSISAGIGFIALFGVVVLNGIVLISEFNRLRKAGSTHLVRIAFAGGATRLRPVLMTATVASLGFLPMALSSGAGAEVQRPLATVVIGGLITATILTLFVLPLLYARFGKRALKKAAILLLPVLFFGGNDLNAQRPVSLQAAIDTALKNNYSLQSERLQSQQLDALRGTVRDLPRTEIITEMGQFNSPLFDTKIGISQAVRFPVVYRSQRALVEASWNRGQAQVALREYEIRRQVTTHFYTYLYIQEKKKILAVADTIYQKFLQRAKLRFKEGETGIMEQAAAEIQRGGIAAQLSLALRDERLTLLAFNSLLGSQTTFLPSGTIDDLPHQYALDTLLPQTHPLLQVAEQDIAVSRATIAAEKAQLTPELSAGYFNQSLRGPYSNGTDYTHANRFSSVQAGISIPLFATAQKARIKAAVFGEQRSEVARNAARQQYEIQYRQALEKLRTDLEMRRYFEKKGLPAAQALLDAANLQYEEGEITYLDWVNLVNQTIALRSDYIETLNRLAQDWAELQSLRP